MTASRHYNQGPLNYFLGHGLICIRKPPHMLSLQEFDCLSVISRHDTEHSHVLTLNTHNEVLQILLTYTEICTASSDRCEVVSKYQDNIHKAAKYLLHVSNTFYNSLPPKDLLDGGYQIRVNSKLYDLRSFTDRAYLVSNKDDLNLKDIHVERIKKFHREHIVSLDTQKCSEIQESWEIRDRMISYPCGLLYHKQQTSYKANTYIFNTKTVPHLDHYLISDYKLTLTDYHTTTPTSFEVAIKVYLNKAALYHDILLHKGDMLSTYTHFQHGCKSGYLSGKHLIFMHLKCINPLPHDDHHQCSESLFCMSDFLDTFLSKLHILIENNDKITGPQDITEDLVELLTGDDLGENHVIPNGELEYYDLYMPPKSTVLLGSCSGDDIVEKEIFEPLI